MASWQGDTGGQDVEASGHAHPPSQFMRGIRTPLSPRGDARGAEDLIAINAGCLQSRMRNLTRSVAKPKSLVLSMAVDQALKLLTDAPAPVVPAVYRQP
ncbi:hypothetical protein GCM10010492_66750 [Saccharothrix mutabilis subsp. mutabilis]|uniref:Uncharacterized protein n=1 Tax=Saccharothrix mutabilis subsp. mutabilis TaxID=66855 RepID=A0ABP3ECK1_9PSEU